jgi:hypothetical protein
LHPLVGKIRALLGSPAHERQIAAAIVLGEIGARDAPVIDALVAAAMVHNAAAAEIGVDREPMIAWA